MFDIDSRAILSEIETDVFFLAMFLDAIPGMCPVVRRDKKLERLYGQMKNRVNELFPSDEEGREIEKMLVCGFSKVI